MQSWFVGSLKIPRTLRTHLTRNLLLRSSMGLQEDARQIFDAGVEAVLPQQMIGKHVKLARNNELVVCNRSYQLKQNVYLVGFGKAVAGMAKQIETILGEHLVKGIISVPVGTADKNMAMLPEPRGKIQVFEGAINNLPDENALQTAMKIVDLVKGLESDHLLITLISGGGSALLPLPIPPITLEEKLKVIKILASRGATIEELNSVRKRLSLVKGGRLAQLAKPAQLVSLILSDIIGDPLSLIASGPTVRNTDDPTIPVAIMKKYDVLSSIPASVLQVLSAAPERESDEEHFDHVYNCIIGNNQSAISGALAKSNSLGFRAAIALTNSLSGEARLAGKLIAHLIKSLCCDDQQIDGLPGLADKGNLARAKRALESEGHLCIITGGETTVKVTGTGKGGRNQEMALSCAIHLDKLFDADAKARWDVVVLCAGTDGIDGPTDAAGAVADLHLAKMAESLNPVKYLENNDSYGFYKAVAQACGKNYLVMTGHTGTNVMDLQVILIRRRPEKLDSKI